MKELMRLNDNQLKKQLSKMHAYDIANLIKDSSSDIQMRFIKLMSLSKTIDVFIELPNDVSRNYFSLLNENQKKQFLTGFEMDELKLFITSFDEEYQVYLISLLSQRKQVTLNTLMSYDEEAIASIMTTEFLTINNNLSIKDATSFVISNVKDNDFIDEVFVVDDNNKLIGSISLKDLISARPSNTLDNITYQTNSYLTLDDSIYQGFIKFKNYGKSVLPILNNELNIIGIITADDVLNEMIEEHEEDIEKMVAVGNYDESSNAGIRAIQRLPWLLISVVLNLMIAVVLSVFERTLVEVIALILFQPMILGMAGNIGTQSIAVTILKINQYELEHKHLLNRHIAKEIGIGFLNSIAVGIAGFVVSLFVLSILNVGNQDPLMIGVTIGISLFGGMLISAIAGVFIPVVLDKLKIDPAVASGPIISTLNDLFALLVYFGIATLIFMI